MDHFSLWEVPEKSYRGLADWWVHQVRSVRETLAMPSKRGWVAEEDGRTNGFVVATMV